MNGPSQGTLEAIFSRLEEIPTVQDFDRDFELFIPNQLTLSGQPVDRHKALNMILEKIYTKGYQPDSFNQTAGGSLAKYIQYIEQATLGNTLEAFGARRFIVRMRNGH